MENQRKNKFNIFKIILIILIFVNLNVSAEEEKFQPDITPALYETPTRYIIILNGCDKKSFDCNNITYYEINKKTGKSLKLMNPIGNGCFGAYIYNYKNLHYKMFLEEQVFEIIKGRNVTEEKTILVEPMIHIKLSI